MGINGGYDRMETPREALVVAADSGVLGADSAGGVPRGLGSGGAAPAGPLLVQGVLVAGRVENDRART